MESYLPKKILKMGPFSVEASQKLDAGFCGFESSSKPGLHALTATLKSFSSRSKQ
jgi:hypothetical protein